MADTKKNAAVKCEETVYLQYGGREVSIESVRKAVMENYESVKNGDDPAKDVKIYLKPEDAKAYYVINDDYAGEVPLTLQ